jgi:polygalacturonase
VNNDGIDIDCCKNVRIANCNINSEDDAIVLKSTSNKICENITVTGCILSSHCNAIKCGTESSGGFRNITVSNCVVYDTYLSGIALEIVDGGIMDLVNINNITMHRVNNPLFIKLGNRARPFSKNIEPPGIGSMKNIQISNIQADEVGEYIEVPDMEFSHHNARPKAAAVFIDGLPERDIENIYLEDFFINYKGESSLFGKHCRGIV